MFVGLGLLLPALAAGGIIVPTVSSSSLSANAVLAYSDAGVFERRIDSPGQLLGNPFGVAADSAGDIFVLDNQGNFNPSALGRILEYSAGGVYRELATTPADAEALAVGPDGNLYVGDTAAGAVLRYNRTSGAFMGAFTSGGGLAYPRGFAWAPDLNFFVTSNRTSQVLEYNSSGAFLRVYGNTGNNIVGLTVGPDGRVYVAAALGGGIEVFDGSSLSASSFIPLADPVDVAFGPDGALYVAQQTGLGSGVLRYNGSSFDTFIAPGNGGMENPLYMTFSSSTPEPGSAILVMGGGLLWYLALRGSVFAKRRGAPK